MAHQQGWIGVDLDGTLAHYEKWLGWQHIGEPVPLMVDRIKAWLSDGREVRIFTARISGADMDVAAFAIIRVIQDWLEASCGLPRLEVTNVKDFGMVELWDDRCVQVIPNTGMAVRAHIAGP